MKEKLTPWRDIHENPEIVGVYELRFNPYCHENFIWSYWTGKIFAGSWLSIESAYDNKDYTDGLRLSGCTCRAIGWRGLAEKPD